MNTGKEQINIYIRKVNKKGIKITLNNSSITPMQFYQFLLERSDFIKFIQDQLEQTNNQGDKLSVCYKFSHTIEFYYEGILIDKNDNNTVLKLRNLSIVHVIMKKNQFSQPTLKTKLKQSNHLISKNNKDVKHNIQKEAAEIQTKQQDSILRKGSQSDDYFQMKKQQAVCLNEQEIPQDQQEKIHEKEQLRLNMKILVSRKCKIMNEDGLIISQGMYGLRMMGDDGLLKIGFEQQRVGELQLTLQQGQLGSRQIGSSLKEIGIWQIIGYKFRGRFFRQQGNKIEVFQVKVKVVHLGRAVQVVFKQTIEGGIDRQQGKVQVKGDKQEKGIAKQALLDINKRNINHDHRIKWSQLNLVNNSEVLILVSTIKLKYHLNQQLKHQTNQKIKNYTYQAQQTPYVTQSNQTQTEQQNIYQTLQQQQSINKIKTNSIQKNIPLKHQSANQPQILNTNHKGSHHLSSSQINIQNLSSTNYANNNSKHHNNNSAGSLYLQLQNLLTLRLYQQFTHSNKSFTYKNTSHQPYHSTQSIHQNHSTLINKSLKQPIITKSQNQNIIQKVNYNIQLNKVKLSYQFSPFKNQPSLQSIKHQNQKQKQISNNTLISNNPSQPQFILIKSSNYITTETLNGLQNQNTFLIQSQLYQINSTQQLINHPQSNQQQQHPQFNQQSQIITQIIPQDQFSNQHQNTQINQQSQKNTPSILIF